MRDLDSLPADNDERGLIARLAEYEGETLPIPAPREAHAVSVTFIHGALDLRICNPGIGAFFVAIEDFTSSSPEETGTPGSPVPETHTAKAPNAETATAESSRPGFLGHTDCTQYEGDWDKWAAPSNWRYYINVVYRQPHLSHDDAYFGVKSGFDRILLVSNNCGLPDVMSHTATIAGETTRGIGGGYFGDGYNVVGFDAISEGQVAKTWKKAVDNVLTEADIEYSTDAINFRLVRTLTASCYHSIHLDSTATHEVGHLYGLMEVYNDALLTMYYNVVRCSPGKASLGYGDYQELRDNY